MYPANADSPFENRHFLTHRPPIISPCSPLTMRTCSPLTMRRPPPIGSPHRGILCVEKIGSAAPELQEWPGTPSKPVKSTNGQFYWLTRKRRTLRLVFSFEKENTKIMHAYRTNFMWPIDRLYCIVCIVRYFHVLFSQHLHLTV